MIQQQVAQQQRQAPPQQMQPQPPQLDQFKTWDEFNEAKAAYVAEQRSRAVTENILGQFVNGIVQRSQAETQQAHTINLQSKLNKAYTDGPSRFADWDEVVTASDLPVPPMMKEAIGRVHDPAAVVHFLGQNPQIHMRLAQADPTELMRGLGMIEANIYRPKTVSSKAPAPAKAVGARAGTPSAGAYRDDFTPAQHKAWLARQK
jgi:hypothetical protein